MRAPALRGFWRAAWPLVLFAATAGAFFFLGEWVESGHQCETVVAAEM